MFKVLFARHRKLYFRLAWKYKVSPFTVYKLAHGKRHASSTKESDIQHELLAQDIIHRRGKHSHSHHDDTYLGDYDRPDD